ncbi:MAG TPA: tryptophan synthase subunit alpha [Chloroflexota bacterium]
MSEAFKDNQLALFPYLTAGFPDQQQSPELIKAMIQAGADGIEIGIPFSDPMADGLTLQRANEQALQQGASTLTALHLARFARGLSDRPAITFMSYYNPILAFGEEPFCESAARAGADGLIVPDLPPEESGPLRAACQATGLAYIFLLSPNSPPERLAVVAELAEGFIYCVALVGVTGARRELSSGLAEFLARVRAATSVPLAVGFGISRPEHVRAMHGLADGVIVASALADLIDSTPAPERAAAVAQRIRELKTAAEGSRA